jgi:hypothetical protein
MRRFTRLTNAFTKKVENHAHMVAHQDAGDVWTWTALDSEMAHPARTRVSLTVRLFRLGS